MKKLSEIITALIDEVETDPVAAPQNGMAAIVRTDEHGQAGWSWEKNSVQVGDQVVLADGRTTAKVDYIRHQ